MYLIPNYLRWLFSLFFFNICAKFLTVNFSKITKLVNNYHVFSVARWLVVHDTLLFISNTSFSTDLINIMVRYFNKK